MRIRKLHPWDLSAREAMAVQKTLREKIVLSDRMDSIRFIAAADISYSKASNRSYGGVAVFTYPDMELIEEQSSYGDTGFPYVPGLLSFREGPVALDAFRKIKQTPDLILFDGQGIAHPRRFGLASHLGLILNKPSVGCAKSRLYGQCVEPGKLKGASTPLLDDEGGIIGAVLRTRDRVNPVFVSQGHRVSLETALDIVLTCCVKYRIPQPIRHVHNFVNSLRKEIETSENRTGEMFST